MSEDFEKNKHFFMFLSGKNWNETGVRETKQPPLSTQVLRVSFKTGKRLIDNIMFI